MRRHVILMCAAVVLGGCKGRKAAPEAPAASTAPAGMSPPPAAPPRMASAAFELEIGGVHERYQDATGAAEHYRKAIAAAGEAQRPRALVALARVLEGTGQRDAAIEALERARREVRALPQSGPGPGSWLGPGDDVLPRLARLYLAQGLVKEAQEVVDDALATAREGWDREEVLRLQVDVLRRAGTLEARIAEKERVLELPAPDEGDLRFLAAALGGELLPGGRGTRPGPFAPDGPAKQGQQDQRVEPSPLGKLLRTFERLQELRPEDPQVRQTLLLLLERSGRIDDAVKLALRAPAGTAACMDGPDGLPPSGVAAAVLEAARIRMRAGYRDQAIADVERAAARVKGDGVPGHLALARIYVELGQPKLAVRAIDQAAREARTPAERRQVAFSRARVLSASGAAKDVMALHESWRKSGDPCLARAAMQPSGAGMAVAPMPAMPPPAMPMPAMPMPAMPPPAMPPAPLPLHGAAPAQAVQDAVPGDAAR